MTDHMKLSSKKGEALAISNKSMVLSVDRLTINVMNNDFATAKKDIKSLKEQIAEVERIIAECISLED